jgi:hypothetical protein
MVGVGVLLIIAYRLVTPARRSDFKIDEERLDGCTLDFLFSPETKFCMEQAGALKCLFLPVLSKTSLEENAWFQFVINSVIPSIIMV